MAVKIPPPQQGQPALTPPIFGPVFHNRKPLISQKVGADATPRPGTGVPGVPPVPEIKIAGKAEKPAPSLLKTQGPLLTPTQGPSVAPTPAKKTSLVPPADTMDDLAAWTSYETEFIAQFEAKLAEFEAAGIDTTEQRRGMEMELNAIRARIQLLSAGDVATLEQQRAQVGVLVGSGQVTQAQASALHETYRRRLTALQAKGGGAGPTVIPPTGPIDPDILEKADPKQVTSVGDAAIGGLGFKDRDELYAAALGTQAAYNKRQGEPLTQADVDKILSTAWTKVDAATTPEEKAEAEEHYARLKATLTIELAGASKAGAATAIQQRQATITRIQGQLGKLDVRALDPPNIADPVAMAAWEEQYDDFFTVDDPIEALGLIESSPGKGDWSYADGTLVDDATRRLVADFGRWEKLRPRYDEWRTQAALLTRDAEKARLDYENQVKLNQSNPTLQQSIKEWEAKQKQDTFTNKMSVLQLVFTMMSNPRLLAQAQKFGLGELLGSLFGDDLEMQAAISRMLTPVERATKAEVFGALPNAQQWAQMSDEEKQVELARLASLYGWTEEELVDAILASRPGGVGGVGRGIGVAR